MRFLLIVFLLFMQLSAVECQKLENDFSKLETEYKQLRMLKKPSEKYDLLFRYVDAGVAFMAYCRNDQRNYQFPAIVRKLRKADKERKALHQQVIKEFWQTYNVKPIVKVEYGPCFY